jgi:hypothetical protein
MRSIVTGPMGLTLRTSHGINQLHEVLHWPQISIEVPSGNRLQIGLTSAEVHFVSRVVFRHT